MPTTERYYDPKTQTEALEGIHDTDTATAKSTMPAASQDWFERAPAAGKHWQNDPTNTYPIETDIPPPSDADQRAEQRQWAQSELSRTDPALLPDSPYTDPEKDLVKAYRTALRNPAREQTAGYPAASWRPVFPASVKQPGE